MVRKVYLHVGMPKCASSTIQAHFYANFDAYRRQGLLYPTVGCEIVGYNSHRPLHNAQPWEMPELVQQIAREAEEHACDRILISSEELTNSRWEKVETKVLLACLNATFGSENVELLYLFRNHYDFVESAFAQFIKGGVLRVPEKDFFAKPEHDIQAFADCFLETRGFEPFEYGEFVERFAGGIFDNPKRAISIHPEDMDGDDVVTAVCRLLDVEPAKKASAKNARYTEEALFYLLHARRLHGMKKVAPKRKLIAEIFRGASDFRSPLFRSAPPLVERIRAAQARDRTFFASHFGADFEKLFSDGPAPVSAGDGPRDIDEKQEHFLNTLLLSKDLRKGEALALAKELAA